MLRNAMYITHLLTTITPKCHTIVFPLLSRLSPLVPRQPGKPLGHFVPSLPSEGVDLLVQMLTLDPLRRITADEALKHPYFGGFDADAYRAGRARDLAERRMRSMDCDGLAGAYGGVE